MFPSEMGLAGQQDTQDSRTQQSFSQSFLIFGFVFICNAVTLDSYADAEWLTNSLNMFFILLMVPFYTPHVKIVELSLDSRISLVLILVIIPFL